GGYAYGRQAGVVEACDLASRPPDSRAIAPDWGDRVDFRRACHFASALPEGDHDFWATAEKSVGRPSRRSILRPSLDLRISLSSAVVKTLSTREYSAASLPTGAIAAVSTRPFSK